MSRRRSRKARSRLARAAGRTGLVWAAAVAALLPPPADPDRCRRLRLPAGLDAGAREALAELAADSAGRLRVDGDEGALELHFPCGAAALDDRLARWARRHGVRLPERPTRQSVSAPRAIVAGRDLQRQLADEPVAEVGESDRPDRLPALHVAAVAVGSPIASVDPLPLFSPRAPPAA